MYYFYDTSLSNPNILTLKTHDYLEKSNGQKIKILPHIQQSKRV